MSVPAVYHHGAGVGRVHGLDASHEEQEGRRVVGYAMVGPRSELELTHLTLLWRTILKQQLINETNEIYNYISMKWK